MFVKTVIRQGEKILQQDNQIKELQKENNFLYQENKDNRSTIEELEDYKRHSEIIHKLIEKELLNLQEINRLGNLEKDKNILRNEIINGIIKELEDCESN